MPNDAPQPDARTRILACSRELFSQRSFAHVSLRDIASAAGVSSALIIKHFHSKEQLFERTVDFTDSASALFTGPFDQLGMTSVLETISAPDNAPYSTIRILTITDGGEESLGAIGRRIKEDLLQVLARRIWGCSTITVLRRSPTATGRNTVSAGVFGVRDHNPFPV